MNKLQIQNAVTNGHTVHWANNDYRVINCPVAGWLVKCGHNGYCVGLTDKAGILQGSENDFYICRKCNGLSN